ncbi:phosphoglycerate mutase [Sulfurirhabdus autotrophica]|uniref:Phosphoglycerate mutase n=1 Tax=Sulfurirhabdus autotrophica TaxID=1706046 RepID=A0A4R3YEC1_9PROT|nr:phosphoglycerate mutase [Sulfurirhabdus autotrophica]TCV90410.1 hypothetical protein EDC63_101383 [Sulfurirhabdus autotrophica]
MEAWLCEIFGIEKQQDWPVAPLTLTTDGGMPEQYYWLRADPVHLRVQRDQIILADSGTLTITQNEADALTESLNRHFEQDGMLFYGLRPDRWYLRLTTPPAIQTHMLPEVAGNNIDELLPFGPEGMRWHGLFNEIQMLFHDHPVNEQREMQGEMPINSVWIWGGGILPSVQKTPFSSIWCNDNFARTLAHITQTKFSNLPENGTAFLEQTDKEGKCLIVLDILRGAGQYGDVYGWQEGMQSLEQQWFSPLLQALKNRNLTALTIHAGAGKEIRTFTLAPSDLWKIWRRNKPLKSYME